MESEPGSPDVLTLLSHRLIRRACNDGFDPFMIPGGPEMERDGVRARACFYYAVLLTPQTTVLLDNQGRGGMCALLPEEIVAAWSTPDLLASQGLSLEDLDRPAPPPGSMVADVPLPREVVPDLEDGDTPAKAGLDDFRSPGHPEPVRVAELLKSDVRLLLTILEAHAPAPEPVSPQPEGAPAPVSRSPRPG